jgi:hypothetical protein
MKEQLSTLFQCLSRRKGAMNIDNFLRNLGKRYSSQFLQLIKTIESYVQLQQQDWNVKILMNIDKILRSLHVLINDRISTMKNAKTEKDKLIFAISVFRDAKEVCKILERLLEKTESMIVPMKEIIRNHWRKMFSEISSKIPSIEKFVESVSFHSIFTAIYQYFMNHPEEFIGGESWKPGFFCCSSTTEINENSTEEHLAIIITSPGFHLFLQVLEILDEGSIVHSQFAPFFEMIINVTLIALFDAFFVAKLKIDEEGMYKLYRLLLKLQELVTLAKNKLNFPKQQKLIEDLIHWKNAEKSLNLINRILFQIQQPKPGKQQLKLQSQQQTITSPTIIVRESTISSFQGKIDWKEFVVKKSSSNLFFNYLQRRKRHFGTVFVDLSFNEDLF